MILGIYLAGIGLFSLAFSRLDLQDMMVNVGERFFAGQWAEAQRKPGANPEPPTYTPPGNSMLNFIILFIILIIVKAKETNRPRLLPMVYFSSCTVCQPSK